MEHGGTSSGARQMVVEWRAVGLTLLFLLGSAPSTLTSVGRDFRRTLSSPNATTKNSKRQQGMQAPSASKGHKRKLMKAYSAPVSALSDADDPTQPCKKPARPESRSTTDSLPLTVPGTKTRSSTSSRSMLEAERRVKIAEMPQIEVMLHERYPVDPCATSTPSTSRLAALTRSIASSSIATRKKSRMERGQGQRGQMAGMTLRA
ncbi:hypothetical protein FKP32DRAFT_922777 [Trametes sanguinea]|nr:hypothetical protein FKP32DRAFT_922777 [Trametes sanguinea]